MGLDPTRTAVGTWSGGRFMHFGEALDDERFLALIRPGARRRHGPDRRHLRAGRGGPPARPGAARASTATAFSLVGAVGHDFYEGERQGAKGFPRFTDPALRGPGRVRRLPADGRRALAGAHRRRRVRPAPAAQPRPHGLHVAGGLGRHGGAARRRADAADRRRARAGERLHARRHRLPGALRRPDRLGDGDPQPARTVARRARAARLRAPRREGDHARRRLRRPVPWRLRSGSASATTAHSGPRAGSRRAQEKIARMRPIAERHTLTTLQLACAWNLGHEAGRDRRADADPGGGRAARRGAARRTGGAARRRACPTTRSPSCARSATTPARMALKGAAADHEGEPLPDRWALTPELVEVGARYGVEGSVLRQHVATRLNGR